jgi:hypothetical protein
MEVSQEVTRFGGMKSGRGANTRLMSRTKTHSKKLHTLIKWNSPFSTGQKKRIDMDGLETPLDLCTLALIMAHAIQLHAQVQNGVLLTQLNF